MDFDNSKQKISNKEDLSHSLFEVAKIKALEQQNDANNVSNKTEGDIDTSPKKKRKKRRTKNVIDGRNFICELCNKAYLSYPALTNHRKAKHNDNYNNQMTNRKKRSRGRPKKNLLDAFINEYQEKINNFFDNDRRGKTNKTINSSMDVDSKVELYNGIDTAFNEIYITNKQFCYIQDFKQSTDHPLLNMISSSDDTETDNNDSSPRFKTMDEALSNFVKSCALKTNTRYLIVLIKFSCLFRECILNLHKDMDYTNKTTSESLPEYCNEFILFMSEADFFGLNSDMEKLDFVELIQYFCLWLLKNEYTMSKIYLSTK